MRHTNKFLWNAICMGGFAALLLTGCNKDSTASGKLETIAVPVIEMDEIQTDITQNVMEEEMEVLNEQSVNMKSSFTSGNNVEHQDLIDKAVEDFNKYLGVTVELSNYNTQVSYFEKYEDLDAQYTVSIDSPANIEITRDENSVGPDGYPTKEAKKKLKPEYYAFYNDDKKLKGLSLMNMKWEKEASVPISVGECKKVAEEFLTSNQMITGEEIEFVVSNVVSDFRVYLLYKNGTEGGIGIGINTYASKVEDFEYMNKKALDIRSKQTKEGEGVG